MLEIKNLTIKYGETEILSNVNVEFARGTVTVIKGPSGSGKSSLLNILGLIQNPNKDCTYYLDGNQIRFDDDESKALFRLNHIGFVFQQNNLLQELTAKENIMIPLRMVSKNHSYIYQKANELVDYVNLNHVADNYPSDLSGGEEQRVAISRALINDADIILADEPTASLDSENTQNILNILRNLAREKNKIVIIVSHDETVANIADTIYEIKERKLNALKSTKDNLESRVEKIEGKKKNLFHFIKYYKRKRKDEKKLNRFLIIITAITAAIATLFVNFGDSFSDHQKDFIDAISDRGIFIINDTLGINSQTDYVEAFQFTDEEIESINNLPTIQKLYPYYEFLSFGISTNQSDIAKLIVKDGSKVVKENTYENIMENMTDDQFRVTPLYPEENLQSILEYKAEDIEDGIILTASLASSLVENPKDLIGKTLEIQSFVPVKLYTSEATKPQEGSDRGSLENAETVKIDAPIYKLVSFSKIIKGILPNSYIYQKSEESRNLIFLNYSELIEIISENKDSNLGETFPGFPEKELAPSALYAQVTSFEDVANTSSKIELFSPTIQVVSKATDVKKIQTNLKMIQDTMQGVSLVLILIVMLLFGFTYFLKTRTRKKEIGILKAIGFTTKNVFMLIGYEMLFVAIKTFVLSIVISYLLLFIANNVIGFASLFVITMESILFCFMISFLIVILSGIIAIWNTGKVDIIDSIRKNK
ncbi:ABC transporter ATP-binding protein/permease [Bacillus kwashiorkori]|uniref:ABC transporter ATP-binding protein/permease n=1 Tax=Bacillus kwashiorkori TaxID=1522318 RepID=UPI0007853A3C|nr:ABC transporter ATP-binding protein/permease [Bacillus kwashiorkori]